VPDARERVARRAARALLEEIGRPTLPIDPFAIARGKHPPIPVLERALPRDIYGACGQVQGRFLIAVSTECPTPQHRRFTAGHELGHYHLEGHVEQMFAGGIEWVASTGSHFQAGATPVEREADFFASELLMPEPLVQPLVRGVPSLRQVQSVARKCDVSFSAAAITVARLTGEPLAIIVSKDGVVEWPSLSNALSAYPWARLRLKGAWAPRGSGADRLGADRAAVEQNETIEEGGLLCGWFPDAPRDVEVVEESIGLGRYGRVLTVLRPGDLPDPDEEQERDWRRMRGRDDD
jgi:hypothetical protein